MPNNQPPKWISFIGLALVICVFIFIHNLFSCDNTNRDSYSNQNSVSSNYNNERKSDVPDKTSAYVISQNFVKDYLKSPSSADFDNFGAEPPITINGNVYTVSYYFDAQNSYGAKLRSKYLCKMKYNGGEWAHKENWQLIELDIDGEDVFHKEETTTNAVPQGTTSLPPKSSLNLSIASTKYTILQGGVQDRPEWHNVLISKNSSKENIRYVVKQMHSKFGNNVVIDLWTNNDAFIKYNNYLKEQQREDERGNSEEYRQLRQSNLIACYAMGYINYIADGTQEKYR